LLILSNLFFMLHNLLFSANNMIATNIF